ncbi:hypothetical protein [Winogradskyella aurantiaca]|uniref:hypothetical protein n=1 Tax=Winogradskyella aurantiaca TaxID=2219558 RepID=UPI000E1DE937|nr:hypothetical protein [Winogradskyella aurantiaca]
MNESKLRALVATAYSDGFFDSRELFIINQRAKELGIKKENLLEIIRNPDKEELILPITEQEKLHFMYDLMTVIYADKVIEESEKQIFYKYLNKLNFKSEAHEEVFQLLRETVASDQTFEDFLKNNFSDHE